ncbi:taste receptor type 2 member 39-like [Latimeria chalumnae]|uniref:taste receptor type 2 member 39-like n=1 Tax=Latimeria chalumnae TaxID=7897 RepID=UPI0003C0FE4D
MVAIDAVLQMLAEVIIVLIALGGNSFIFCVYFLDYKRNKTLQPNELLVTFFASFNILIQITLIWFVVYLFNLCTYFGEVFYKVMDFSAIFLSKSSFWFIAWLCFIYFLKIVRIKSRFFMGLQQKMSSLVIVLILITLLVSFSVALPVIYMIKLQTNSTSISELCKDYYIIGKFAYIHGAFLSILTSFLPLVIMLISSMGIVIFLCTHSRKMKKNAVASSSSNEDAHTAVAVMIICLILLYVLCIITVLSGNLQIALSQVDETVIIVFMSCIYLAVSPVILIIGTVKLRHSFKKLLTSFKRW